MKNLFAHLFSLQRQIDEYLLEFFVDEIYAELFETVSIEYFETVYVQDAKIVSFGRGFHRQINTL